MGIPIHILFFCNCISTGRFLESSTDLLIDNSGDLLTVEFINQQVFRH